MKRLDELTLKLVDGQLTPAEAVELDALVSGDPTAEAAQVPVLEIEGALRGLRDGINLAGPVLDQLRQRGERQVDAVMRQVQAMPARSAPSPRRWQPRRRLMRRLLGAAACVAVIVSAAWLLMPAKISPIGRVVQVEGQVEIVSLAGQAHAAAAGMDVGAGQTLRTGGGDSAARIDFADQRGTLELAADTVVRCDPRPYLASGLVRGAVQSPGGPLVIVTPQAVVSAGAARLTVAATGPEVTRLSLEAGQAELVRQADGQAVRVDAGFFVIATADLDPLIARPWSRTDGPATRRLDFSTDFACFAPDGRTAVAVGSRDIVYWQEDDTQTKYRHQYLAAEAGPAISADRKTLALPMRDGVVSLWDLAARKERTRFTVAHPVRRLALAPEANWVAGLWPRGAGLESGKAYLWDASTGAERTLVQLNTSVGTLAAAPDGRLIAVVTGQLTEAAKKQIHLVEPGSQRTAALLPRPGRHAGAVLFSPDSQLLAIGSEQVVELWNVPTRRLAQSIPTQGREVSALAFSPDGRRLAWGGRDGSIVLWDIPGERESDSWYGGAFSISSLTFAPTGQALLATGRKAGALLWDLRQPMR